MSTTTSTRTVTPAPETIAAALFNDLRTSLMNTEKIVTQIVATKAWEPLGYTSLTQAWAEQMHGIRFAGVVQAHLLYAMFEQGATTAEVSAAVHGIGQATADAYLQAYCGHMTPEQAHRHAAAMTRTGSYVQGHYRRPGVRRNSVVMSGFTDDEIHDFKNLAAADGMKLSDWARTKFREAVKNA